MFVPPLGPAAQKAARSATSTILHWAWDAFRGILKGMVTSAVELAWKLFVGLSLAVLGVSYATSGPPSSPWGIPGDIADGFIEIVHGMRILVMAAEKYIAS